MLTVGNRTTIIALLPAVVLYVILAQTFQFVETSASILLHIIGARSAMVVVVVYCLLLLSVFFLLLSSVARGLAAARERERELRSEGIPLRSTKRLMERGKKSRRTHIYIDILAGCKTFQRVNSIFFPVIALFVSC